MAFYNLLFFIHLISRL